MVPIISIVGVSGSGKTTLIEKVITELTGRGLRVGLLKHDAHGFEIDHEGKDSWRHKRAGAVTVALSSPQKHAIIKDVKEEWTPERIIATYLLDHDVVITEGYKTGTLPKLEVIRAAHSTEPSTVDDGTVLGYITDVTLDTDKRLFGIDDFAAVADFIEERFVNSAQSETVSLVVDGVHVTLKPFIEELIRESLFGMIKSLKGCEKSGEIELRIKRKE
jgi:molybdopterin-guanine dinucleotide biosynthesis protein B